VGDKGWLRLPDPTSKDRKPARRARREGRDGQASELHGEKFTIKAGSVKLVINQRFRIKFAEEGDQKLILARIGG
jgi:hypothetical protein